MNRKQKAENITKDLLRQSIYPDKKLPSTFHQSLRNKLLQHQKSRPRQSFNAFSIKTLFAAATLIAVFIIGIIIGRSTTQSDSVQPQIKTAQTVQEKETILVKASTELRVGESVTIKLVYNATTAVDNVNFTITLPNGMKFDAADTEIAQAKELEWEGALKKGENIIPFVVSAKKKGTFILNAVAEYNSTIHKHEITLTSSSASTFNIRVKGENNV